MAILQDQMARPEGDDLNSKTVSENIKVPAEFQEAYERVVIAGMKVMFSKETHKLMLDELQKEGSVGEKLGKGIAGLMLLLVTKSNNTIPPQIIIPAGVNLISQAGDFMRKSKLENITNADIADAMEIMISAVLDKFGVSPDKINEMVNQYSNENIPKEMGA